MSCVSLNAVCCSSGPLVEDGANGTKSFLHIDMSFLTDGAGLFHLMGPTSVLQLTVDIALMLSPDTLG